MIKDGIYKDLSITDYHGDSGLSKSGLSVLAEFSPLHYQAWRRLPSVDKVHFRLGHLAHYLILQPDEFKRLVKVPPADILGKNGAWSTKAFKEWREGMDTLLPGALIVKQKEVDAAYQMRDHVFNHPEAEQLLTLGKSEISGFYTLPSGVTVKCRPDHWPCTDICTDLKTARTAHPEKYGSQSYRLHYHWSGYMCTWILSELSGKAVEDYYYVVVEKEDPWDVTVHKIGRSAMELSEKEVQYWLKKYEACYLSGEWPGYPKEILDLHLPRSAYRYNPVLAALDDEQEDMGEYYTNDDSPNTEGF